MKQTIFSLNKCYITISIFQIIDDILILYYLVLIIV